MADNTELNAGSGGDTIATDDIGPGVKHQLVKLEYGTDGSATMVSDSNPLPIDDAGGSLTIDGTVTANAGSGTFTVDGSGVTQPVSGTVTANAGSGAFNNDSVAAEGAALASGVLIQGDDGTDRTNVLVDTDGHVQVDVLSGGGGGTQYTEGDTDATITGTAMMMEDAADTLRAATGDTSNGLDVDVTRVGGTVTVTDDGSFTLAANSGVDIGDVTVNNAAGDPVLTAPDNTISTNNSTTTPLGGDAVFTGTGDDCLNYASVTITIDSSHDSATDGMTFQFSMDDTNWDDVYTFTYTAADGARRFQYAITARYFRIVYTNGSTIQTHFRVQTILHRGNVLTSIHRLVNDTDPDRSAQLVKAAIIAQAAGSGDFSPVQTTAGGNLKVSVEEFSDGVDVGNGTVGAETLRVTVASDSTGTIAATQSGTWNVNDISGTVSLPTGAATAANQLADGHNVTVDNGAAGAAVNIQDGGNTITVDGTVTADAGSGTFTVDGSGVTQPISAAALPLPSGAATAANQLADGHNVTVDNGAAGAAVNIQDGGNTITVDGTVSVDLNAGTNTNEVVGDVAHDAAAAGNPVLIAGVAQDNDDTAPPNRVTTESDATRLATDFDGSLHVRTHGPQLWSYHVDGSSALTDASVHAAPGANLSLYVTDIIFSSGAATAINAFFEESTTTVLGPYYLEAVAGRGMSVHLQTPKKITANTALTITTSAAIAHSVDVMGYIGQG